jgi:hypothetical protein
MAKKFNVEKTGAHALKIGDAIAKLREMLATAENIDKRVLKGFHGAADKFTVAVQKVIDAAHKAVA